MKGDLTMRPATLRTTPVTGERLASVPSVPSVPIGPSACVARGLRSAVPARRLASAAALVVLFALAFAPAAAAQQVGTVVEVVGQVTGTPPGGAPAPLAQGDPVVLDMKIATGADSFASLTLDPEGSLQLGANAEVTIDRAEIDAATGASSSALSVLIGKIRLALSSLFRGSVEVDTPTATIGVKGTILAIDVADPNAVTVWLEEGEADVTSKAGGTVTVRAGYFTTVRRGAPPTDPAPFDPASGAAAVRALPPEIVAPHEDVFDDSPFRPAEDNLPPRRNEEPNDPPGVAPRGEASPNDPPPPRGPG